MMKIFNEIRKEKNILKNEKHILVCSDTGCSASNSMKIIDEFNKIINSESLDSVKVIKTGCFGLCSKGPFVAVKPDNVCYAQVSIKNCKEIIDSHIKQNIIVDKLLLEDENGKISKKLENISFYKKQNRQVLKLCGLIDPENIDHYIKNDGYKALEKILTLSNESIITMITDSKLRGRGGAGFNTGLKWKSAYEIKSEQKYVICNADEGDPGAFMDRSILEGNPHSVIEGIIIAAYAINANKGYIYIRAEYPNAVKKLKAAISKAYEYKILGNNILDSNFSFDLEIRIGAGAFVCGEETALLESIEGKIGHPRGKPPYPTIAGLYGCPTVINNVETLANIPLIILSGSKAFNKIGTENSGGTKVFALGGDVVNTGLVEVPIGITLREIIFDIGGGINNNKKFKAAQTGGPSGGCIPEALLDTKMDYESLKNIGSMMGSGGLIVVDDSKCMVSLAKFYLDFTVSESCGKCTACRIGTKRMSEILEKITTGKAQLEDLDLLEDLSNTIIKTSLCGLGQSAPNPVLSTLKYFKEEYINHIVHHKCDANICNLSDEIFIDPDKCKSCGLCQKACSFEAIEGTAIRKINKEKCVKCKLCIKACPFNAIIG